MKTYPANRFFGIIILILFSFSCSSPLDFNQVSNLKIEPVYVGNLSYFDIPAKDFVDNRVEQDVSFDAQDFHVFRDDFFRKNLKKVDFIFEITNSINRAYSFDIIFLNQDFEPVYTIAFTIPAANGGSTVTQKKEVFEGATLDVLKTSDVMAFVLQMNAGPALSENSLGSLKLRSSATVYLTVE
ncbi:MAG: hypothetical protein ACI9L6_000719 [Flavobacterium sp.]